jgi:GTP diphosphokinase / guanosine-3',5'-bis(diphosphate) 3'-diphosphatase
VYIFTPRGEVIALPKGATPVDFAYAIHTEVGHRTIGARVNGRLVALESSLENGDTVENFTSKAHDSGPGVRAVAGARPRCRARRAGVALALPCPQGRPAAHAQPRPHDGGGTGPARSPEA